MPRSPLVIDALTIEQRHQGAGHRGDESLFGTVSQRERLPLADRECFPRLDDTSTEEKAIAPGRRKEVRLELDGQDCRVGRHQRVGCIPTCAVQRGGEDAGMHEAVLLRIG